MVPPTLYLPLGRPTEIDLRSEDVTHSFWVPAFLFKRDAIPGMTNVFDITPTRTGTFPSRCAQFCGLDHALMTFVVRVVPAAAYDALPHHERSGRAVIEWMTTTDHKKIGIMYVVATLASSSRRGCSPR